METLGEDAPLIPQRLFCSWDQAVLSGHVAHKDRCQLQRLSASLLSKRWRLRLHVLTVCPWPLNISWLFKNYYCVQSFDMTSSPFPLFFTSSSSSWWTQTSFWLLSAGETTPKGGKGGLNVWIIYTNQQKWREKMKGTPSSRWICSNMQHSKQSKQHVLPYLLLYITLSAWTCIIFLICKERKRKKGSEKISIEILGITEHWTPKVVISTTQYF